MKGHQERDLERVAERSVTEEDKRDLAGVPSGGHGEDLPD